MYDSMQKSSYCVCVVQDTNYPQLDIDDVLKIKETERREKLTVCNTLSQTFVLSYCSSRMAAN